jgi:hypothetical protein
MLSPCWFKENIDKGAYSFRDFLLAEKLDA